MTLRRLQLFEFEDLPWFPAPIRDFATDYLVFMQIRFTLHRAMVPLVKEALERSGATRVVDLCSGAGGPVQAIYEGLVRDGAAATFTLTDRYPNLEAFRSLAALHPDGIAYSAASVGATDVPPSLPGLRTMFNAFHHFAPAAARAVLLGAVDAGQPIAIFEIPERRLATILPLLLTPLFMALATPFIRPFRWSRLFWTYIVPVVPLICMWDGVVSQCRAYTVAEMLELTRGLEAYDWSAGQTAIGTTPGKITYLTGMPKRAGLQPPSASSLH